MTSGGGGVEGLAMFASRGVSVTALDAADLDDELLEGELALGEGRDSVGECGVGLGLGLGLGVSGDMFFERLPDPELSSGFIARFRRRERHLKYVSKYFSTLISSQLLYLVLDTECIDSVSSKSSTLSKLLQYIEY